MHDALFPTGLQHQSSLVARKKCNSRSLTREAATGTPYKKICAYHPDAMYTYAYVIRTPRNYTYTNI